MRFTTEQPVLGKTDFDIIINHLQSGEPPSLFSRYNAEELAAEVSKAKVIDDNDLPADVVRLNSTVKFRDEQEEKIMQLTVVAPKDADMANMKISATSPLGITLMGCRKGQRIVWEVPLGEKHFYIVDVS